MLLHTPKRERSIFVYLQDIKKSVDSLAVAGSPISIEEHIEIILYGLPEEYDAFITSITSRTDPYTVEEVEALLLAQEERLERYRNNNNLLYQVNATSFNHTKSSPNAHRNTRGLSRSKFSSKSSQFAGDRSTPKPWLSSSSSSNFTSSTKIQCQICWKTGHYVSDCWHRYDRKPSSSFFANHSQFAPLHYVTMMNHPFSVLLPLPMNLFGTLTVVHPITLCMMLPLSMTKSLILDPKLSK